MENNIDIFCEIGFLEKFLNSCPQLGDKIFNNNYKNWRAYFDLLCGNCDIRYIDVGEKDFIGYCDENSLVGQMFIELLKSYAEGRTLICLPNERENMEISINDGNGKSYFVHEHAIFFLDKKREDCKKMEEDYGLIFISPENMYDYVNFLFVPDIQEINEHSILWNCMSNYSHPCNTIILIDGYIINETKDIIDRNLSSIFDALLPANLNESSFCIHIFTKEEDDTNKKQRKEKEIKELLCSLRSYNIQVKISFERNLEHDRHLLTNYCLFSSGYGFILTDAKRKKGTHLSFFPICHYSMFSLKNNVYKIVQNLKKSRKVG